ncbi:MAG: LysR family transcriptional regulator [Pseudomonadota bacterium]|nr:LysR family transcriptional regulator [Pseudomonadota bacterium]
MQLTIRQIEAFLAVAGTGNFSRAAAQLNTAQPAVSQAVRELEASLAVRLFDRTTRRVELTEAGAAFRDQLEKGMEEIERAVQTVRDLAALRQGLVRVAAPPFLAATLLPPVLTSFAAAHPDVRVELADVGTERIVERVLSGRSEIGVGTFSPDEKRLERLTVLRDNLMLFCRSDDRLAKEAQVKWRTLRDQPLVTLTRDSGIRLLTEVGFAAVEATLSPAYEVTQITTAIALVEAGLGVSVLPGYAKRALAGREVAAIPLSDPPISREVVALYRRDRTLSTAARAFIERLRDRLETPRTARKAPGRARPSA